MKVTELERYSIWRVVEKKYRLPSAFMEALSKGESNWKSDARTGSFVGLLQVGPMVLDGYNKANRTGITLKGLLNPRTNALVAAWQIRRVIDLYARTYPGLLKEDWESIEWVSMLLAGWNSGYSKKAGVLKVVAYLVSEGLRPTHRKLFRYSAVAGATRHLRNAKKERWQRGIATKYFRDTTSCGAPEPAKKSTGQVK